MTDDNRAEDKNPAFSGVMIKCGQKVLLCKRRADIPNTALPEYWSVPAGYVETNEDIKTAAIRETFEETEIELDATSVKFLSAYPAHGGVGVFYDYVCVLYVLYLLYVYFNSYILNEGKNIHLLHYIYLYKC